MAYMRAYFDQMAIVIFNKSKKPIPVKLEIPERFADQELQSNFGSELNHDGINLTAILEGNSFEVITLQE